jgi:uncharacterized membrane-anchored protein YjiN (DUF445 family)
MNSPKETAQQILRTLFTNAHGDSADSIKKYQGTELPSFGIMYPQIKELAANYEPSNEVALELISKNTREARIIAMVLSIPETLTDSQIIQFIEKAVTEELRNLLARHILAPIFHLTNYEKLNTILPSDLIIKGLVQSYRIYKSLPDFNHSIKILRNYLTEHTQNSSDILNYIEAIYRKYVDERNLLKSTFEKFTPEFPNQRSQIGIWLSSIKELEELYGDHKF